MLLCIINKVVLVVMVLHYINALNPPHITGKTPPPVNCPNSLCENKSDGNYIYLDPYTGTYNFHYFVQCSNELSYCQACWPLTLEFSYGCNQCLYSRYDKCDTTKKWKAVTTTGCPDMCPDHGNDFDGNIEDPYNLYQYIACWKGITVGCVGCPAGLQFNEKSNSCLYDGIYKTEHDYAGYPEHYY